MFTALTFAILESQLSRDFPYAEKINSILEMKNTTVSA